MTTIPVQYIDTRKVTCTIDYEEYAEDPREWDNLGTMVLNHNRYNLPNEVDIQFRDYDSWDEVKDYIAKELDGVVILPVQMYDHSRVSIYVGNTADKWDGGQAGFIYVTRAQIQKEYSCKNITQKIRDQVSCRLVNEVETYSQYMEGEVYQFSVRDAQGNELNACGGYYGEKSLRQELERELREFETVEYKGDTAWLMA
jgi:hypothetical protein